MVGEDHLHPAVVGVGDEVRQKTGSGGQLHVHQVRTAAVHGAADQIFVVPRAGLFAGASLGKGAEGGEQRLVPQSLPQTGEQAAGLIQVKTSVKPVQTPFHQVNRQSGETPRLLQDGVAGGSDDGDADFGDPFADGYIFHMYGIHS